MSLMFRFKYLAGLIPSTTKLESEWAELIRIRQEWSELENAPELKRFDVLKQEINSTAFQEKKSQIKQLSFLNSPEGKIWKEWHKLEKSAALKRYFNFISSSAFKSLGQYEASDEVKLYLSLQSSTSKVNSLANNEGDDSTQQLKTLVHHPVVKSYLKVIKSKDYVNFLAVSKSEELRRLEQLRTQVEDPAFKQQIAFLKNKKRYLGTPEYQLEAEYQELKVSAPIKRYNELSKHPNLHFFDRWEIMLNEDFSGKQLSVETWEPEHYWGSRMAGASFSQAKELQGYQGLKNIEIKNQILTIISRVEGVNGKAWDPKVGLVPRQFEYSSATLNSEKGFRMQEGILEAKVRFKAHKALTSAFSLTGTHPFPQIDLFRSGHNRVGVGIVHNPSRKEQNRHVQIGGLDFSKFHIFRLELFNGELIWKINNQEVYRDRLDASNGGYFLNLTGSIHHDDAKHHLPHHFEVDWIRCLTPKA